MEQKLFKSTSIVAAMTMLSRLFGFARDVVLAFVFGAGADFDAYVIAFKIPNFLRRLFAEGAFSQAFVPILAEFRTNQSERQVKEFVNRIAGTLAFAVLFVVLIAELLAPLIILVFAPGFVNDPDRYHLATHMLRITSPYLFLISLAALAGGILNTCGQFAIPAFSPVLLNISLIGVSWLWAPHTSQPIYVLGWGVLMGGAAQLLIQLPYLKKLNLLPFPKFGWRDSGVRRVIKLMVPALFGVSVAQMSLLIDNFFASFLPASSISWLYYSDRLTYLPLGVISVALATVVMPYLSRHHAAKSYTTFSATLDWALRCNIVIAVPAAVGLFVLAGPLLSTLIQHGEFDVQDVVMTSKSLMAFSLGLPGFMLVKVLASAFYSQQNIRTPVKVAAIAVVVNLILDMVLILPLAHAGLALATSCAAMVNAVLLWRAISRQAIFQLKAGWQGLILRIVLASALMAVFLWWQAGALQQWFDWGIWQRAWHLAILIFLGISIYCGVLLATGLRISAFKPPSH